MSKKLTKTTNIKENALLESLKKAEKLAQVAALEAEQFRKLAAAEAEKAAKIKLEIKELEANRIDEEVARIRENFKKEFNTKRIGAALQWARPAYKSEALVFRLYSVETNDAVIEITVNVNTNTVIGIYRGSHAITAGLFAKLANFIEKSL